MGRKEGFCDSCQQNKDHRRVPGVFSLVNLLLLGIPSLFGISTWACVHCSSTRVLLLRKKYVDKKVQPRSSHKSYLPKPPPNGGLKPHTPEEIESKRTRLYSEKYRDAVAKRIVSGITSIAEVMESLKLSDSEVVDWVKDSFQRKEDRVEMLREALERHQKVSPNFNVADVMSDLVQQSQGSVSSSRLTQSRPIDDDPDQLGVNSYSAGF